MTKYIDKSALIAEIERRMQELRPTNTHKMQVGEKMDRDVLMWLNALTWVKKVIDTLEVKEEILDKEGKTALMRKCVHKAYKRGYDMGVLLTTNKIKHNTKDVDLVMEMTFDALADICYREQDENSQLISVSLVVKDDNSGEIRVYNSNEYGGISEYNENQV